MSRNQVFSTVSITASAFVVWLFIFTQVQPNKSDILIMTTFFVSLITWLGCLLSFLFYKLKVTRGNREVIYAHIAPSIRQGFLISTTLGAILFLQLIRVVSTWDISLVIIVAILFEVAFRQSPRSTKL